MKLSLVFYFLLLRTAVGTIISLLPLMRMRAAERHIRFNCVLGLVLAGGAAALHNSAVGNEPPEGWPRGIDAFLSLKGSMPLTVVLFCIGCLIANGLFGTFRRRGGRTLLIATSIAGVAATLGTARFSPYAGDPGALTVLTLNGLLGGLFMGAILNAMTLGHFYLMIRGLPLAALKKAGWFVAGALVLRMLLFGLVLLFWEGASELLLERELVWTAWRIAFGFIGPLTLLWMVSDTVRLKHTQAATGLLYVAVGFALMGELAAMYLEVHTGLPV